MSQTLVFEKGLTTIDRSTLTRSASYELAKGNLPASRPIPHHELLQRIIDTTSKMQNIEVIEDPIYATEAGSLRVMFPGKKEECPIENYLIQRLVTRIQLKTNSDTDMNMAIGIGYNEKGITMAFGPNIWVCQNQNVFGQNIMHTFGGDRKVPFDKMMEVFEKWMLEFNQKREMDYSFIEKMKARTIEENAKQLLYGKLINAAVLQNMNTKYDAPLNQTQVADFIRASYSPDYEVKDRPTTVWDLQQMGTSILKPKNTDLVTVFQDSCNFNNFIINEFKLN